MEHKNYQSEEEFFEDLSKIKPCDLRDKETTIADAVEFCKKVLTCFLRTGYHTPDKDKLELQLYRLGVCKLDKVDSKFISGEKQIVGDLTSLKNDIQFPLQVFNQVFVCKDQESFSYSYDKITDGGFEYSWAGEWIKAQNENVKNVDEPVQGVNIKQIEIEKDY